MESCLLLRPGKVHSKIDLWIKVLYQGGEEVETIIFRWGSPSALFVSKVDGSRKCR